MRIFQLQVLSTGIFPRFDGAPARFAQRQIVAQCFRQSCLSPFFACRTFERSFFHVCVAFINARSDRDLSGFRTPSEQNSIRFKPVYNNLQFEKCEATTLAQSALLWHKPPHSTGCCGSSVVEHIIGNDEVGSSILPRSTISRIISRSYSLLLAPDFFQIKHPKAVVIDVLRVVAAFCRNGFKAGAGFLCQIVITHWLVAVIGIQKLVKT